MPLTCQEEVFALFRNSSGAKRIEMMCGLMNMCIPLEIRFFEAVLQDLSKKEFNSFRDAELKANSRQELEHICKCDLLAEKTTPEFEENEMNGNGDGSQNSASNEQKGITKFPSRSKLIISLCLLQPTNHQCSSITYNSLREQFMVSNLLETIYNVYIPKNYPIDGLLNEILLLLTMAMYHPAFTYEERDLLKAQKEEVELAVTHLNNQMRLTALQQSAAIQSAPGHQVPPAPNAIGVASVGQATSQPPYANPAAHHQHNPAHTQHPPAVSQQAHAYHFGGQHPQANSTKPHLAAHLHQQPTFPISFIQNTVPIANLTYTPTAPQTGAAQVAPNAAMPILRINSPPSISSISSTSPSPTISPSSAKMAIPPSSLPNQQPIAIKLENNNAISMYQTATGLPPNSLITFVNEPGGNPVGPGIPFINLPPPHAVIVETDGQKTSSSVSSNTSSASCYNCGSVGHRGSECTSGGEDNR